MPWTTAKWRFSMSRPGTMLYFDTRPCLKRLTNEQKGQLFEAILDYAEFSVVPDFGDDVGLAIAWDFIQPKIDRDNERYEQISKRRAEAAAKRWGASGAAAPDNMQMDASDANASTCMQALPTTTPTTSPTTTPTSKATATWPPSGDFNSRRNAWLDALDAVGDNGPYQPIIADERRGPL